MEINNGGAERSNDDVMHYDYAPTVQTTILADGRQEIGRIADTSLHRCDDKDYETTLPERLAPPI